MIAIEVDVRMVSELRKRVMGTGFENKLKIMHGDAIKTQFPFFNLCIANIPYQISSPLIFKLLSHRPHFRSAILMVQNEFAKRMVARPGDYIWSRLSINCQLLARVSYLKKVSAHNFRPPPKVESALVRIEPRKPAPPINFIEWDGLIKICFNRRHRILNAIFANKNVINAISKNHKIVCQLKNITPCENIIEKIKFILKNTELADKRPRHLDIPDFLKLMNEFNDCHFHFK